MAFDGIMLAAVAREIDEKITGCKITKIYQPAKEELMLYFSNAEKNVLSLCCGSSPRIYIGEKYTNNPPEPTSFCMVMRKYLIGAELKKVRQVHFDRVLEFSFETVDVTGSFGEFILLVETMGRYSNITLYESETKIIVDCLKHIDSTKSTRILMPKEPFYPAPSSKLDPTDFDFNTALDMASFSIGENAEKILLSTFNGICKISATEIVERLGLKDERIDSIEQLKELLSKTKDFFANLDQAFSFNIYTDDHGKRIDLCAIKIEAYADLHCLHFSSVGKMIEEYFIVKTNERRLSSNYEYLLKGIKQKLEKEKKNLNIRIKELQKADNAEIYNTKGQLLLCNLGKIKKGDTSVKLANILSNEQEEIEIMLLAKLTPNQNAQNYFKKFHKAKRTKEFLEKFIGETKENIAFLEELLCSFYMCETENDIADIQKIMISKGLLKKNTKKITSSRERKKDDYMVLKSPLGNRILIGKNAPQNEKLSLSYANKEYLWFHVKDHGGCHLVLENKNEPSDEELLTCAKLALYYSSQREEKNMPVDYTRVKYLKRHPSHIPGLVIYTNFKTIHVSVDENDIFSMKEEVK